MRPWNRSVELRLDGANAPAATRPRHRRQLADLQESPGGWSISRGRPAEWTSTELAMPAAGGGRPDAVRDPGRGCGVLPPWDAERYRTDRPGTARLPKAQSRSRVPSPRSLERLRTTPKATNPRSFPKPAGGCSGPDRTELRYGVSPPWASSKARLSTASSPSPSPCPQVESSVCPMSCSPLPIPAPGL